MRIAFFVTLLLFTASFVVPFPMGAIDYKFNPLHAALFAAFAPIGVVLFPATVILLAQKGYESKELDLEVNSGVNLMIFWVFFRTSDWSFIVARIYGRFKIIILYLFNTISNLLL